MRASEALSIGAGTTEKPETSSPDFLRDDIQNTIQKPEEREDP